MRHGELEPAVKLVRETATRAAEWLVQHSKARDELQAGARGLAYTLGRTLALALLIRQADWSLSTERDPRPLAAVRRFARHGVNRLASPDPDAKTLATDTFA